jgi:hypothetical protein
MCPTRSDLELARPLCGRSMYIRKGQHGHDFRCHGTLTYIHYDNAWQCADCGHMHDGTAIAARHSHTLAALAA